MQGRITEDLITDLEDNQVFVFGSNTEGKHYGGAAKFALSLGAVMGQGEGEQGDTYAIPTLDPKMEKREISYIQNSVINFIAHADRNKNKQFLVTEIGCGIAGFDVDEIAPLFKTAISVDNIHLPLKFWNELVQPV